ncbi:FAD-dependent oxidoreductase [Arthrobacter sp. H20]|uniref:FAD-dependent oxidoreductase n=1 Tax=Arthrobacter sp. H20 TaxID=1267981 RepID=UPI0006885C1C|nr:FAD-dependent oxidoreductase [Arthrobacter sp. H20]
MALDHEAGAAPGTERTTCAIVGGGPAGLVLGLLLARAGVEVTVVEKHADFLRDFRGDTVHPTTLDLLDDLGLFDKFDALPQSRVTSVSVPRSDGGQVIIADFSRLPLRHPYIAMVPQWDLLNLLAEAAAREPMFTLLMEYTVTGVIRDSDRVSGVNYDSPAGPGRLLADLTVACDGRGSIVTESIGLPAQQFRVEFDVWWYRIPTHQEKRESLVPRVGGGQAAIVIPRDGYLQIAALIPKGSDAVRRARGIDAFRAEAASLLPDLAEGISAIRSMDEVKHLSVRVDRLRRWHAQGVLCIGDAAHAMSPVGGVGINLAVQDAVATARILAEPLQHGTLRRANGTRILARVRRRRALPVVLIQSLQRVVHARLIMPALNEGATGPPRLLLNIIGHLPPVTVIPAAVIGVGPRPEKVPAWACRPPG